MIRRKRRHAMMVDRVPFKSRRRDDESSGRPSPVQRWYSVDDLLELIRISPTTPKVRKRPGTGSSPDCRITIYALDLSPDKTVVAFRARQRHDR